MSQTKKLVQTVISSIEHYQGKATHTESGEIIQLYDGIAMVSGLPEAQYGESVDLPQGIRGLVLELQEDKIGVLIFGDYQKLKIGDRVTLSKKIMSIPVSNKILGRVVDALGRPIDGLGPIKAEKEALVEKIAPGIVFRKSVSVPLQTGLKAIDSLIPIGRGQRELIIGDRSTGKTTIAIDTMINQAGEDVICIYVAIGQKESTIAQIQNLLAEKGTLDYSVIVSASASSPASQQYLAPYSGTAIAEYFMAQGRDVLIIYDDLTKHAWSYRQISLILKRPAGREAYPGDVFYLHSRLLERACRLHEKYGGGSITALPIVETQEGDISAYIPTNIISITDGQIYLEKELFNAGMRPAINVGASVSRVGSSAQVKAMKQVAGKLKGELAQYRELAAFSQFASDLDEQTKKILRRGSHMYELLKQDKNQPLELEKQIAVIWLGTQGYTEAIELSEVKRFEWEYLSMLKSSKTKILSEIRNKKEITPEIEKELKAFTEGFIKIFSQKSHESAQS
ncbi:F0F1 ATP synthase subunit alpha [Candidatus Roizmanbacteria bacterium RIFOXYA1_FULL_41_12]|uniref:ATP synthase subunit alpha n=1 Tax=Candidatus Roizmanbacteria bacterium RIFOXYA1_FULL_41_12 TaxID=1802082 RepID=A0A1F7K9V3_9BACT|nr:MAG: F0F1 ATP synthase subunit alpha [Candidatus Roizmanbacteria bacterium RIFOXYA2_FULL_41_8]OGK64646.1 MAG: F0F1 ATP synthase subunit alpha [Candidatus Roizmanbacteria bacterium RIFOXYA1_FULL_41_12]OGK67192.1 MAG: F0F1 ATP synthase subunit alpha [Candidatus Roizmanbacteria bacterium RIFOXYB1_FULL_41_27]OGK75259.1 MAG: F0F1 ATP synthase subunit alpha [Candidatus Roizmanbacteria bacterium RIFOXYD1_FULL_41_24]